MVALCIACNAVELKHRSVLIFSVKCKIEILYPNSRGANTYVFDCNIYCQNGWAYGNMISQKKYFDIYKTDWLNKLWVTAPL